MVEENKYKWLFERFERAGRAVGKVLWYPIKHIFTAIPRDAYDHLSQQYTDQVNKNMELSEEIGRLTQRVDNVSQAKESLLQEGKFLESELEKYMGGVLKSPEYQKLQEAKEQLQEAKKKVESERDGYLRQSEDRGRLVDQLKKSKRELFGFVNYVVREKSIEPLIKFLENDKYFSEQPIIFINPKTAKIITYTDGFKKELDINNNLKGQSYLTILNGRPNVERLRMIKKFLNLEEEKEFDIDYEIGGKIIPLHIVKKLPIHIELDLSYLGKKKDIEAIACVPLFVEKIGRWKRKFHHHNLDDVLEKIEEEVALEAEAKENSARVDAELINKHDWTSDKIAKYNKYGEVGAYLHLSKILNELKEKDKAIAEAERRKAIKAEKRKMDRIFRVLRKRGASKLELKEILENAGDDYRSSIRQCRALLREKRGLNEPEKKELVGNILRGVINSKSS